MRRGRRVLDGTVERREPREGLAPPAPDPQHAIEGRSGIVGDEAGDPSARLRRLLGGAEDRPNLVEGCRRVHGDRIGQLQVAERIEI